MKLLPSRSFATEKTVMKEVIESNFDSAYPIEAYVNTYEGTQTIQPF